MAAPITRSFLSVRKLILLTVGVFIVIVILRTPTAPYFSPGSHPSTNNEQPRRRLPAKWRKFLNWSPPSDEGHYPGYSNYRYRDYDPNIWESFKQYAFPSLHTHYRRPTDNTNPETMAFTLMER